MPLQSKTHPRGRYTSCFHIRAWSKATTRPCQVDERIMTHYSIGFDFYSHKVECESTRSRGISDIPLNDPVKIIPVYLLC